MTKEYKNRSLKEGIMNTDAAEELAKQIREKFPQVATATHKRMCHWSDDGYCHDIRCDRNPCDDARDTIVVTLRKL